MLTTLIETPALGSLVQSILVPGSKVIRSFTAPPERPRLSASQIKAILQRLPALRECPAQYQDVFNIELGHASQDAMMAAILMSLPNTKSLTFGTSSLWTDTSDGDFPRIHADDFADDAYTLTRGLIELSTTPKIATYQLFKHLSSVTLIGCGPFNKDKDGWSFDVIAIFLKLPSLKNFSAGGFRDVCDREVWICPDGASPVTHLSLYNNRMSPESIRKVLRSCKALEQFKCERLCNYCGWGENVHVSYWYDGSYVDIHLDIARHRKSLRHLHLSLKACGHDNYRDLEPIESLADLEVLESLEADQDVIWGNLDVSERSLTQFLPTSLKRLVVLGETCDNVIEIWDEYAALVLSRDHWEISVVEVRHTDIDWLGSAEFLGGVRWKEVPDYGDDEAEEFSEDGSKLGNILLYRSQIPETGNEVEDSEQSGGKGESINNEHEDVLER